MLHDGAVFLEVLSERHHQVGGKEFLMEEIGERHRGVDFGDEVYHLSVAVTARIDDNKDDLCWKNGRHWSRF